MITDTDYDSFYHCALDHVLKDKEESKLCLSTMVERMDKEKISAHLKVRSIVYFLYHFVNS